MHRSILALAATCASAVLASAQVTSSPTDIKASIQATTAPVAYVYLARTVSTNTNDIVGYAAAANGALTPLPGSPYAYNMGAIALNGSWLFGVPAGSGSNAGQVIDSFSIAPNGALTYKTQNKVDDTGGYAVLLFLDHTGSSLYANYYTTNDDYVAYSINQSTGVLTYLNTLHGGPENNSTLSFIGNNEFAYSSSCYHFTPDIYGVQRESDGSISWLNINPLYPSNDAYCPYFAAADPTNHLAVAVQPMSDYGDIEGPYQLAVYTADSSGNLTTTSTKQNMPSVAVGSIMDYNMSPSGKFLAVGGTSGLQVFHFNGANPITKFTGQLVTNEVDQMFWDNANHLYAINQKVGKLWVFTVTSTGVTQAPGSPHFLSGVYALSVLPKN